MVVEHQHPGVMVEISIHDTRLQLVKAGNNRANIAKKNDRTCLIKLRVCQKSLIDTFVPRTHADCSCFAKTGSKNIILYFISLFYYLMLHYFFSSGEFLLISLFSRCIYFSRSLLYFLLKISNWYFCGTCSHADFLYLGPFRKIFVNLTFVPRNFQRGRDNFFFQSFRYISLKI